jgi:hypothetical protein
VVEESELSAADRLDMAAARMAATSRPAMPGGISATMKAGKMRLGLAVVNEVRDEGCIP